MKDQSPDDTVIDRLKAALVAETLPKAAREYAQHLLNRLSQPVRVTVLGAPLSGKSELVNMFTGRQLMPSAVRLPTTEIVWGETEAMTVTSTEGTVERIDHIDLEALADAPSAFLKVEFPAEILKRINLLEVVTNGAVEELESAVDWAVRRTDIALWCSQEFGPGEQSIWSRVPDSLKDHAFLVLTKADELSAGRVLSSRIAGLESIVAEEFHSLFAVATLQAVQANLDSGGDEGMFHASGGAALTSEVLRHAERGRRADFDSAHMFLARYQIKDGSAPGRPASKPRLVEPAAEAPAPEVTPEAPVEVPETAPSKPEETPVATPQVAEAKKAPASPPEKAPVDVATIPARAATPESVASPKVENVELFMESVRFLKRRGDTLGTAAASLGEGKAKPLIEQCVDAVEHLVDLFSEDDSGCAAADAFIDELAEASDMMVLMQVEDGDGPAADAVTLLLQLRRDMEMQLAA